MRRREFIASTGAVAATWLAARAQQTTRMRHVGVLMTYAEADPDGQARLTALLATLRQSGWTDNRNCQIDIRWSAGDLERMRRFAKELVALAPDVMAVMSTAALEAVQ